MDDSVAEVTRLANNNCNNNCNNNRSDNGHNDGLICCCCCCCCCWRRSRFPGQLSVRVAVVRVGNNNQSNNNNSSNNNGKEAQQQLSMFNRRCEKAIGWNPIPNFPIRSEISNRSETARKLLGNRSEIAPTLLCNCQRNNNPFE